jgi:hypothetical protein
MAASATLATKHRRRSTQQASTGLKITSGLFAANCAWLACAVITHNLRSSRRPRRHLAPRSDQRAGPLRRPSPQTHPAPAHPLAPPTRVEKPVAQRHRLPDHPATSRLTQLTSPCPPPPSRPDPRNPKEKLVPASRSPTPTASTPHRIPPITARNHRSTESG